MNRIIVASLSVALLTSVAAGDVLVAKDKRGQLQAFGAQNINAVNWRALADESNGIIVRDGYDGVAWKKSERASRESFFPRSTVVETYFSTEPADLVDGYDYVSTGNYGQAIGAFRAVVDNPEAREVYRLEAQFQIGICYYRLNNVKNMILHFRQWNGGKSKYTPIVYRLMGEIQTARRQFGKARTWYDKIGTLPDIPESWRLRGRLGGVKVTLAERKFGDAESTARSIAAEVSSRDDLKDPLALALALQAQAILGSGAKDRMSEAQTLLERAAKLDGVETTNRAFLHNVLGDVLYTQGMVDEARYPYLRVVTMYPDETSYVAHALRNAGQCFLDLAGRTRDDADKADAYLIKGMRLLADCARGHQGTPQAMEAAKEYNKRRQQYEEAKQRQGGDEPSPEEPKEEEPKKEGG